MNGNGVVKSSGNIITLEGNLPISLFKKLCGNLHFVCKKQGYSDVVLDFSKTTRVFESFIVPALPVVACWKKKGVDFEIIPPEDEYLCKLFRNTNWEYYLGSGSTRTSFESEAHVSAMQFTNSGEQYEAVDRIMELILARLEGLSRGHLKALYWSLTEITDNVLNHSESPVGGFVQATAFPGTARIEFIVADGGIGIPKSLGIAKEEVALERAIQEGVTRNKKTNQGNGLFGSYQVAVLSNGEFEINSSKAYLLSKGGDQVKVRGGTTPYPGTCVRCVVDCTKQDLLEEALRFRNKPHDPPFDYIEQKFESGPGNGMTFVVEDHSKSLGSRQEGIFIRNKISNLLSSSAGKLSVDFKNVYVISSSFADEVFGRLFVELGPVSFMSKIEFRNVDPTVRSLIDRAISQRLLDSRDLA